MRTSLGISAGTDVVCSARVTTAPNDAQSFDYRIVSADADHSDLGDLVASSIELMTTQLPSTLPSRDNGYTVGASFAGARPGAGRPTDPPRPTGVAVAYRGREQEQAIRSATAKQRELRLVPEGTAALTYLRYTGLLDRYETVAIIDLGASGLTVTVADRASDEILCSERTTAISGKVIDDLIYHHLVDQHFARRGSRPHRTTLTNRGRAAKEHLSVTNAVTIDHAAGHALKLTRTDLERLIEEPLREMVAFTGTVFEIGRRPDAVAVIGGGANIPAVLDTLVRNLDIPVCTVPDPDAVIAKGAALVADSMQPSTLSTAALGAEPANGTFTKVVGTLVGALVVVGLVIGYGVKTHAPAADDEVSPAGTTSGASQLPPLSSTTTSEVPPTWTGTITTEHTAPIQTTPWQQGGIADGPTTPTTTVPTNPEQPSSTDQPTPTSTTSTDPAASPTLRPDPNLPPIPFPELLGPLLGSTPSPTPSEDPAERDREQELTSSTTATPTTPGELAPKSDQSAAPTTTPTNAPGPDRPGTGSSGG
ncbi:Hsp70 family protein [Nocardia callitridis]|uniref:Hsp70 family protein n=1 Tax=Nocardia callitridis TaxID=648753 RepID=A0ABP9L0T7_9NOCA